MSLIVNALTAGYGGKKILNNLSLNTIDSGSVVAVLGANAVGKSTLLKAIAGLLSCEGDVELHGQSLHELNHQQRIQQVAYLPQALPQTSTLLAYEMVYSACRATVDWGKEEIEKRIEHLFYVLGIEALALKKMNEMSGGQRQMVGLIQILVRRPNVLLLDEPTSALDLHWQLNVLQAIRNEVRESQSIALFACHDLNLALRFCDQVLLLSADGVLVMGDSECALTPAFLRTAYGIEGRIESCSKGYPIVLADSAIA
jgi:iron complex transport system ATP-binding protein